MERFSWKQTRKLIRADRSRLLKILRRSRSEYRGNAYFHPASLCVVLYRISNYFYRADRRWLARIIWHVNILLTGADITEPANIGEELVVLHPAGVAVMGTAGKNLTLMACSGLGGEMGNQEDIGAGPGSVHRR